MDQIKTGSLIRTLRRKKGLTQRALAEQLHVSDKAVSKWERGRGAPEVSLLARLAEVLAVDLDALLKGELEENLLSNGNLKKTLFYVCPDCGSLVCATDPTEVRCCGKKVSPLEPKKAEDGERLNAERIENEWFLTSDHPMTKEHYISFVALLTGDTVILRKLYPEWGLDTRLPYVRFGTLVWYCTRDGLFTQRI